jgi:DNA (cytosine-5)-methyltransferase 1
VSLPIIDLFAGAGGLSLGLAAAGLTPTVASEMDADAVQTYEAAHAKYWAGVPLEVMPGDINKHSFKRFKGQIAVVAGGPPCQPFSLGGLRNGEADSRNGLPAFVQAVRHVEPDAFLLENVPGLATGVMRLQLDTLLKELTALGFTIDWRVLRAADYGVPQRRQRLVMVGVRGPKRFTWPEPMHGDGRLPWVAAGSVVAADRIIGIPNSSPVTYAKRPDVRPSPWDGHVYNGGGRPINPRGLAPTVLASMGGNKTPWLDGGDVVEGYHAHLLAGGAPRSGQVLGARRITAEEAALLQTFPAGMPWAGTRSSRYRQVGNAVPVRLAEAIGAALAGHLRALGVSAAA